MKKAFFLLLLAPGIMLCEAQLIPKKKCDAFYVDVLDGKINGVRPDYTMGLIKEKLPCFTSTAEVAASKCGGTVFYQDRGVYFYTDRNYVEIKPNFKGKLSIPLLGASRGSLYKWLGHPILKDNTWDAFQTAYGILVLHYNRASKVALIQLSTESTGTLKLCE
jgi:hypothetical protein